MLSCFVARYFINEFHKTIVQDTLLSNLKYAKCKGILCKGEQILCPMICLIGQSFSSHSDLLNFVYRSLRKVANGFYMILLQDTSAR